LYGMYSYLLGAFPRTGHTGGFYSVLFEMSRNEQTFFSTIWCGSSIWRALGALPSTREGHTSPPCSAHQGSQS